MKFILPWFCIGLLMGGRLSAQSSAQEVSVPAAPPRPKPAVSNVADYALTLRDPFSPIGHRPPELVAPPIEQTDVSLPSVNLIDRARSRLGELKAVMWQGTNYIANLGGTIVKVGDELSTTVDGVTVTFIIRAISPGKIVLEPQK